MNNRYKMNALIPGMIGSIFFLSLIGCKKEVTTALPEDKKDVGLNFYTASEVMQTAYNHSAVAVYVDKYQNLPEPLAIGVDYEFPTFNLGLLPGHEYPRPAQNSNNINYTRYV